MYAAYLESHLKTVEYGDAPSVYASEEDGQRAQLQTQHQRQHGKKERPQGKQEAF